MGGPGPIVPAQFTIITPGPAQGPFRAGQQLTGTIQGQPGSLTLVVGGARVPLSPNLALELRPGQTVQVQVTRTSAGLQLQLTTTSSVPPANLANVPPGAPLPPYSPGTTVQAQVQGTTAQPFVQIGGSRIPLVANSFAPGQRVSVEVLPGGQQVRLTALPSLPPASSFPLPEGSPLANLPRATAFPAQLVSDPNTPAILVAGSRIPIPRDLAASLPQTFSTEVVDAEEGAALRFPARAETLPVELRSLARAIGTLTPEQIHLLAANVAPKAAQGNAAALQRLIALFTSEFDLGADLEQFAALVRHAAAAAGIPKDSLDRVLALIQRFGSNLDQPESGVLEQAARAARSTVEARLAGTIARGESVPQRIADGDLRAMIETLRGNAAFRDALQARGTLDAFDQIAQRVLHRLTGTHVQNLHGLEQPYLFFEAPFPAGSGIDRAQIHVFGDGSGKREFEADYATVVIDVSTARLGDLWVQLNAQQGHCTCRFRASSQDVAAAIEENGHELAAALVGAGYASATVEARAANVDRLAELAAELRRFSGLSLNA